jgi:putative membrane protein
MGEETMLWIKALHIIFMVTWFAGLFYLPRLFVYHAMATDDISLNRFKIMERKLYYGIMTPGAVFTLLFGTWLLMIQPVYLKMGWMHGKLTLVLLLVLYHLYLGRCLRAFKAGTQRHSHVFYRILNEIPVLLLAGIVVLVVVKPFI